MLNRHRIYQARLKAGMTQDDLVHALRTILQRTHGDDAPKPNQVSVSRWERGIHSPSADIVAAVAEVTGQPIDFFYEQDEEPVGVGAEEDPSRMTGTGLDAFVSDLVDRVVEAKVEQKLREREQA